MPADRAKRVEAVMQWRASGPQRTYRELGEQLGGVSAATAWRLDRSIPAQAAMEVD
jgi:hypothetical protein